MTFQCPKCKSNRGKIDYMSVKHKTDVFTQQYLGSKYVTQYKCEACYNAWNVVSNDPPFITLPPIPSYSFVAIDECRQLTQEEFKALYLQNPKPPTSDKLENSKLFLTKFESKTIKIPPDAVGVDRSSPGSVSKTCLFYSAYHPSFYSPSQEPKMKQIHISKIFEAWQSVEPSIVKLVLNTNKEKEASFWKYTGEHKKLGRVLEHSEPTQVIGTQWPPEPPIPHAPKCKYVLSTRDKDRPKDINNQRGRMHYNLDRNCWDNGLFSHNSDFHPTICADLVILRRPVTCDDFGKRVIGIDEEGREWEGILVGIHFDKGSSRKLWIVENQVSVVRVYKCEI